MCVLQRQMPELVIDCLVFVAQLQSIVFNTNWNLIAHSPHWNLRESGTALPSPPAFDSVPSLKIFVVEYESI
jgi:hypothetical protein